MGLRKNKKNSKAVKPSLKSFNCKKCGGVVNIKVLGQTLNVVCSSCYSVIDANDPDFAILQEGFGKKKYFPYIPLNARGKLHGVLWEVTGFVVKSDSGYFWNEYLLFNPYHGYRWLVEVDGHWALYRRIRSDFATSDEIFFNSKRFKVFNRGQATVEHVQGEFFWRLKRGDITRVEDYIAPPFGLSVEKKEREENWTYGHHVEAEVIQKTFQVDLALPGQYGIGQLQPSTFKEDFKKSFTTFIIACSAIFFIFILRALTADNEEVFRQSYTRRGDLDELTKIKTQEFELKGGTSNVKLTAKVKVRNEWMFFDALLVNAETQQGIPLPLEVSYYAGSDWKEGGQKKSKIAYNVPDGRYYLSIASTYGVRNVNDVTAYFTLNRDVTIFSNTVVSVVLVLFGPILLLLRQSGFEVKRWKNSDYSPYHYED